MFVEPLALPLPPEPSSHVLLQLQLRTQPQSQTQSQTQSPTCTLCPLLPAVATGLLLTMCGIGGIATLILNQQCTQATTSQSSVTCVSGICCIPLATRLTLILLFWINCAIIMCILSIRCLPLVCDNYAWSSWIRFGLLITASCMHLVGTICVLVYTYNDTNLLIIDSIHSIVLCYDYIILIICTLCFQSNIFYHVIRCHQSNDLQSIENVEQELLPEGLNPTEIACIPTLIVPCSTTSCICRTQHTYEPSISFSCLSVPIVKQRIFTFDWISRLHSTISPSMTTHTITVEPTMNIGSYCSNDGNSTHLHCNGYQCECELESETSQLNSSNRNDRDPKSIGCDHSHVNLTVAISNDENTIPRSRFASRTTNNQAQPSNANLCSICLCTFDIHARVNQLPCQHVFHSGCIKTWLCRKNSCPLCRVPPLNRNPVPPTMPEFDFFT